MYIYVVLHNVLTTIFQKRRQRESLILKAQKHQVWCIIVSTANRLITPSSVMADCPDSEPGLEREQRRAEDKCDGNTGDREDDTAGGGEDYPDSGGGAARQDEDGYYDYDYEDEHYEGGGLSGWVPGDTHHVPEGSQFEYLDHTADVQLHGWGDTMKESFEWTALAMFAYMTDIRTVEKLETQDIEAEGDDYESLLFHFLDELLFLFSAEPFFIAREVKITEFDVDNFKIKATGGEESCYMGGNAMTISEICDDITAQSYGETFDLSKHPQGTEVKAITYSAMQVHVDKPNNDVYVIIDI